VNGDILGGLVDEWEKGGRRGAFDALLGGRLLQKPLAIERALSPLRYMSRVEGSGCLSRQQSKDLCSITCVGEFPCLPW
jgi:hypothetical protein